MRNLEMYLWVMALIMLVGALMTAAVPQPRPDCQASCGNLTIPFPFGTTPDCYIDDSFLITCNSTDYNPPRAFLRRSNIQVLSISLLGGEMRVRTSVARDCYNQSGHRSGNWRVRLRVSSFPISNTRNIFTAVGCDTLAFVQGNSGQNYTTGCVSLCDNQASISNGSCSGIGCCQTSIPKGVRDFQVVLQSFRNHSDVLDFNPCSYALVVEEAAYNFSSLDIKDFRNRRTAPVVLDWAVGIGNGTCQEAQTRKNYACQFQHSECVDSINGQGYRCNCSSGFQGNPYLIDGCQDVDECETSPCSGICTNVIGSFSCSCPEGYEGDGRKDGTSCRPKSGNEKSTLLYIALGVSIGLLALLVGSSWIYWMLKKRKLISLRQKFFQQNGGLMLQQQLSKHGGSVETAVIFTAEDLNKATDNFSESRVIGQGGFGTVYKGVLPDNRVVAIKKSKICDGGQIEQFINEIAILTQINHRNVVKLLGCCLETEVPLLVYEFISNGTLSEHIHGENLPFSLSWEMRLKIATETAGALAYLHSATSVPIIHRDIKSTNILLDNDCTAKVSDFGASRVVPLNQSQLTTLVQGTWGYLDPEYFHSSQLTEKSDVYSFGVVLAELLTGGQALSFDRPEKDRNLAMYFVNSVHQDRLLQILDDRLVEGTKLDQLKEVSRLTMRCLRIKGEERPTMKEVARELEGLRLVVKHPWLNVEVTPDETELLLNHNTASDAFNGIDSEIVGYDSIQNQILVPLAGGR